MLGTQDDCGMYYVDIVIVNSTNEPAFKLHGHPRPISRDAWGDACLTVPRAELLGVCVREEQEKRYVLTLEVDIMDV